MSLRLAVVLAALVVCAQAQTQLYLNFGTYAEDFDPAPGFVLTTVNDNSATNRGGRPGLLQSSTVLVVKVGDGVRNIREGQTVYPALQRGINAAGQVVTSTTPSSSFVDTRAFCPQPFDIHTEAFRGARTVSATAPNGPIPNPISQVEIDLTDPIFTTTATPGDGTQGARDAADSAIRGFFCIYHESQLAATINNQAIRGSPGSSQIYTNDAFVSNIAGTTRPRL